MRVLINVLVFLCFSLEFIESRSSYCPTPKIKNGKYRYRQRAKFVKYTCNVGFVLYGDRYNNCDHGKWDGPSPKCVRPGCRKVNAPTNGMIYPSHVGAVLHFYCKSGFQLFGPNVTHCNGTAWSTNLPICLPSNTKPPLSCDFENADLCGWTHDLNHDFDWRRMQFSTPSGAIGTGPSHDHTFGIGKAGHYMYIESSSRNVNDTARLISPVYEKATNTCFVFFYHMYGSTIGTLRVYLKKVNETWDFDPSTAIFQQHGNQGNKWIRFVHLFDDIPTDFQMVIEGVRGDGYVSDIAIDDVSIVKNCNLTDYEDAEISTTTETEEFSTTDFLPDDLYSCEGRCYSSEIQMGKHRTCACDENCFDRNQCCPDYIDFCLLHAPSEAPTETTFTIPPSTQTTQKAPVTLTSTTSGRTELTTEKKMTTYARSDQSTPEKQTTKLNTPETTKATLTEKTTTELHQINGDPEMEHRWEETTDFSREIPNYLDDVDPIQDVAHLKKGNSNEKIVILKLEEKKNYFFTYVLMILGVVVAGFALVMVRTRRERRSRRFRSGSHGGSASDVRFLTSDELLDLNLDYE